MESTPERTRTRNKLTSSPNGDLKKMDIMSTVYHNVHCVHRLSPALHQNCIRNAGLWLHVSTYGVHPGGCAMLAGQPD